MVSRYKIITERNEAVRDKSQIVEADDFEIVSGGVAVFYRSGEDTTLTKKRTPVVAFKDWDEVRKK